jgi:hypothetical protein
MKDLGGMIVIARVIWYSSGKKPIKMMEKMDL